MTPTTSAIWRNLLVGRSLRNTMVRAVLMAVFFWGVFGHLLRPLRVDVSDMEPTIRQGSLTLVNTLAFRQRLPRRGDVVALRLAGPSYMYLSRVVGEPGERIEFVGGRLHVDDVAVDEPWPTRPGAWDRAPVVVGDDELFVVGDDRATAQQNGVIGCVHRGRVVGGVLW